MKRAIAIAAVWSSGLIFPQAVLADASVEAVPTSWRLENYNQQMDVVVWFSGSTCGNGKLTFPSTATADQRNRFYSLILTAKTIGRKVGVFYETSTGQCQIVSFYID